MKQGVIEKIRCEVGSGIFVDEGRLKSVVIRVEKRMVTAIKSMMWLMKRI